MPYIKRKDYNKYGSQTNKVSTDEKPRFKGGTISSSGERKSIG